MGAIFKANSPKPPKSVKNPIVQWTFQGNHYSLTCTAKSPFAVNRGFNYGSDRHSAWCVLLIMYNTRQHTALSKQVHSCFLYSFIRNGTY